MSSITVQERLDILAIVNAATGSGPSLAELNTLANQYLGGASLQDIANAVTGSDAFEQRYDPALSDADFVEAFIDSMIGGQSVPANAREWAIGDLTAAMEEGASRADVVLAAISALRALEEGTDAMDDWGDVAAAFEARTEAAIPLPGFTGAANIVTMSGNRAVEVLELQVDRDSALSNLASINDDGILDGGPHDLESRLDTLYLSTLSDGAGGDFELGARLQDELGEYLSTDGRVHSNGLIDVRVFNARDFDGDLKLGARLSSDLVETYLDVGNGSTNFRYLLGDGGSNLHLAIDPEVDVHPDFSLTILGGAGNDRINLAGLSEKQATRIDGGQGYNTLEVNTSTLATGPARFLEVSNIQKLVVAGSADTSQLVGVNFGDIRELVIATTEGADTFLTRLNASTQELSISGKNQTLGADNSNNDQMFGDITLNNTIAAKELDILLQNTADVDGRLSLDLLHITGGTNSLRTLHFVSSGEQDTSNLIADLTAFHVTGLKLSGSQDLWLHASDLATWDFGDDLSIGIDASELSGRLVLALNAELLRHGSDDSITGTRWANDWFALYGAVDTNTTISDIETLQFGWLAGSDLSDFSASAAAASGRFDAANASGVHTFVMGHIDGSLSVENMNDGSTVVFGDSTGGGTQRMEGLETSYHFEGTGTLTLRGLDPLAADHFLSGARYISTEGFSTINTEILVSTSDFQFDVAEASLDGVSDFITTFVFNDDADELGVVWQIDNFQNIGARAVSSSNASRIEFGENIDVSSASDINIQSGLDLLNTVYDGDAEAFDAVYGADAADTWAVAGNTVITSDTGDNYTIVLTGIDPANFADGNILGIA